MKESKAHRVQNTNGVKSNRNVPKEDYTGKHRRSTPKNVIDPRMVEVEIMLSHASRGEMNKKIELYKLDSQIAKWERDNWVVKVVN